MGGQPFVSSKKAWQTARERTCLPDLRVHDLRHSAASFMINAGIDLYAVGRVLGHADYKSTMRYSHLANETLLDAVEAGALKLGGAGPREPLAGSGCPPGVLGSGIYSLFFLPSGAAMRARGGRI